MFISAEGVFFFRMLSIENGFVSMDNYSTVKCFFGTTDCFENEIDYTFDHQFGN